MSDASTPSGELGGPPDRARRWTDIAESVRSRTDLFAKTISGLGTAALTAIGISKFADVYPVPPVADMSGALRIWIAATILGFLAMAWAIVAFSRKLWHVNEPLFMDLGLERVREDADAAAHGLDGDELARVQAVFLAEAQLHDKRWRSLTDYADSARDLRAEPSWWPPARAASQAAVEAQRQAILRAVDEAQARALVNVVRMRAGGAVRSGWIYAVFLTGLIAFGLGADYLDSQHAATPKAADECAKVARAISTFTPSSTKLIPEICGESLRLVRAGEAAPATASSAAALLAARVFLLRQGEQCAAAVAAVTRAGDDPAADRARCALLGRAADAVLAEVAAADAGAAPGGGAP